MSHKKEILTTHNDNIDFYRIVGHMSGVKEKKRGKMNEINGYSEWDRDGNMKEMITQEIKNHKIE